MFGTICIQRHKSGAEPLDLGLLAEALLFYDRVQIVADPDSLYQLARALGPDLLLEYVERGAIRLSYLQGHVAVVTRDRCFHATQIVTTPKFEFAWAAPRVFAEALGREGRGRRLARRLESKVELIDPLDPAVRPNLRGVFHDPSFVREAARVVLRRLVPDYPQIESVRFEAIPFSGEYVVETNVDFELATRLYRARTMQPNAYIAADLLLQSMDVSPSLYFAARYSAEVATDSLHSDLIRLRVGSALARTHSEVSVRRFQEFVLDGVPSLGESILSGRRSFRDLLDLLQEAAAFRNWVQKLPSDADLLKAYVRDVTRLTWLSSLPTKIARWVLFTGLGVASDSMLGPLAGVAISAADSFFLEPMLRGWKPDQFVNTRLRPFVSDHSTE